MIRGSSTLSQDYNEIWPQSRYLVLIHKISSPLIPQPDGSITSVEYRT